ncbi:winged helix-turn-helix transcriptional regulator [Sneathiella limimaris]|uniref:winged helix-turn-helix transcriptional regulator n=1 Tax=Sneathiella limimaris TaxID=1964213 RepID=UPI00146AE987|nr:helix-turn-helix domain-containing protein [Sneathiella limimaris]
MKWQELKAEPCSIAKTLSIIGERWTVLILRECFRGVTRFDKFEARLGMPRALLSERLKSLVAEGVLERIPDPEHGRRSLYQLTEMGQELRPVLLTMMAWGDKHLQAAAPPKVVEHLSCGHTITPTLTCPDCQEEITSQNIVVRNP